MTPPAAARSSKMEVQTTLSDVRGQYLEILKRTLTYSYWDEPGVPVDRVVEWFGFPYSTIAGIIQAILKPFRLKLTYCYPGEAARVNGEVWPAVAFTMVGMKRLDQLQNAVTTVVEEDIPGDFIETGVWRGGASILMRAVLRAHGVTDRKVWVADSFQGLPKPDVKNYPVDKGDIHFKLAIDSVGYDAVRENFKKFDLLDSQVVFLKGWFKDTLPTAPIEKLAILRLDGDMYESTIQALDALYPRLVPGGFCIVDDYGLERCRRAIEDYRQAHSIQSTIHPIDRSAVYWRK